MKLKVIKIEVMSLIEKIIDKFRVKARENILNPILSGIRRKCLNQKDFTIISNNCWGGHVYRFFGASYDSPTVGLYMFSEYYVKFVFHLKEFTQISIYVSLEKEIRHKSNY